MHKLTTLFKKEWLEILRERQSLLIISLISILTGPIVLLLLSNMLAGFESQAEKRLVYVDGISNSEIVINHLARETATVKSAPPDYELKIKSGEFHEPVLVIPPNFDNDWQQQKAELTIVTDSSNGRVHAGVSRLKRWLSTLESNFQFIALGLRGIKPTTPNQLKLEEKNLANPNAQFAKIFSMLPYFFILAILYAIWTLALDATIGEIERNTFTPLLLTRVPTIQILLAKWVAISLFGAIIGLISVLSFIPAQALMAGETLKAMFSFGFNESIYAFLSIFPLSSLFTACLMWIGMNAQSLKNAQTKATGFMLVVTIMPIFFQASEFNSQLIPYLPIISSHIVIADITKGLQYTYIFLAKLIAVNLMLTAIILATLNIRVMKKIKHAN